MMIAKIRISSAAQLALAAICVCGAATAASALPIDGQAAAQTSAPAATAPPAAAAAPASKILSDAQVEANVLKALAGAKSLASENITTTAVFGKVTLSGTVPNEASRELAETLASHAVGVKSVEDNMTVNAADAAQTGNDPAAANVAPMPADEQGAQQAGASDNGAWAYPEDEPQQGTGGAPNGGRRNAGQNAVPQLGPQIAGQNVTIPLASALTVRVFQGIDSRHVAPGTPFQATVLNDVVAANTIAIPRGAVVTGVVVAAKHPGFWSGVGSLVLQLNSVTMAGKTTPIVTYMWAAPNARAFVPNEGIIRFRLQRNATVTTVSQEELARMADSVPLLHGAPPEDVPRRTGDY